MMVTEEVVEHSDRDTIVATKLDVKSRSESPEGSGSCKFNCMNVKVTVMPVDST